MPIGYILAERPHPLNHELPKKFYAQAKSTGELTFRELSKEIAEGFTTVSDTDVLAVLNDLTKLLKRHLGRGKIVRFGDFGTFQVTVGSEGAEDAEKFHMSMIRNPKVSFRAGIDLKEMLNNLKYVRVK